MTPDLREAALRRISALIDLGRIRAARAEVVRCLGEDPNDPGLLELLGLCLIRLGEPSRAADALRSACAAGPDRPHRHYLLGFACRDAADATGALAGFQEAVRLAPEEPVYLRALAELLAERGLSEQALEVAHLAVAAGPESATNHVTLGYVASSAGLPDLARREYQTAVGLDPNSATAWNNLGCLEMASGDRLGARERFHEALRLDPAAARARKNLGLVSPAARPPPIYDDFDVFLGEALRELRDAGRLGPTIRFLALTQALGAAAVQKAITARAEAQGAASRIGVAAGAAAATAVIRLLGRGTLVGVGVAAATVGVGWLVTASRVTPLRRRYAEHIARAKTDWQEARRAWLDGKQSRDGRDRAIDRLLERLAVALDREPIPGKPSPADAEESDHE
ncbi:MAG: tetratricopeptide repeat protein [Myxococcales bacterium]|nr:tetratricopeptide repeat protein [Myxococcales bacterium]